MKAPNNSVERLPTSRACGSHRDFVFRRMKSSRVFYLVNHGYRPASYELADHLRGEGTSVDSDGDSENSSDKEWIELTVALRDGASDQIVGVIPASSQPLALKIHSPNAELANREVEFLQRAARGAISAEWSNA